MTMYLLPHEDPRIDPLTFAALVRMAGHHSTMSMLDRKAIALVLRAARREGPDTYAAVLDHVMVQRAEWRTYLTLSQRDWQARISRRPARGVHHDSWNIREKYVRCTNGGCA